MVLAESGALSFEKKLSALLVTLILSAAAPIGCQRDDEDSVCDKGETQSRVCTNGKMGAQSCEDGAWGACTCDGGSDTDSDPTNPDPTNPDPTNPDPTNLDPTNPDPTDPNPTTGPEPDTQPNVGATCFGPEECKNGAICVLQNGDDIQGICTVTCSDWTDCTSSKIGQSFWDCCDLSNGTAACAPSDWGCEE